MKQRSQRRYSIVQRVSEEILNEAKIPEEILYSAESFRGDT